MRSPSPLHYDPYIRETCAFFKSISSREGSEFSMLGFKQSMPEGGGHRSDWLCKLITCEKRDGDIKRKRDESGQRSSWTVSRAVKTAE